MADMFRTWRADVVGTCIFGSGSVCIKVTTSYTLSYLLISFFVRYSENHFIASRKVFKYWINFSTLGNNMNIWPYSSQIRKCNENFRP